MMEDQEHLGLNEDFPSFIAHYLSLRARGTALSPEEINYFETLVRRGASISFLRYVLNEVEEQCRLQNKSFPQSFVVFKKQFENYLKF